MGQGCAVGRKQCSYIFKDYASAPTVTIESLMLSYLIDAKDDRDVATVDVPCAFIQANMDKIVHMKIEGTMEEMFTKLEPKIYMKYLQNEKGKLD
eukprot:15350832-Ditylum_brightwellii.AAC.1